MLEPVSKKTPEGIESKYFSINSRPGKNSNNTKLSIRCSSLLNYLASADANRDEFSFRIVKKSFNQILELCQTEEELRELNDFLKEAAGLGGYAEQFYNEVSKDIHISGKEQNNQALQKEKEEKRKPVSRRTPTGIESSYFGIQFRPGKESRNTNLLIASSSLLTYLTLADIYRESDTYKDVEEQFYQTLLFCQTNEEMRELDNFLREAAQIGGYANQFYEEKSSLINKSGKEQVRQYLKQSQEEKEKPVSRRIEGGIESLYFDVEYRPGIATENFILEVESSSLLMYLALADIYGQNRNFEKAQEKLFQLLSSCNNEKEVQDVGEFLKIVSDVGGYANQFYNENIVYVRRGMAGVEKAKQSLENTNKQKEKDANSIAAFNERYSNACEKFERIVKSSTLDDEEIASLLKEFNELQGELYDFNGQVAKEFISETDYQLDSQITWLRNAYQTVEELKETFNI